MGNYLTIDGGTTNTRIYLVLDGQVVDSVRFGIGSVGGKENTERLKAAIKEGISNLLSGHGKKEFEIERILASGMITSDGGLCSLPHLETPCGLSELAQAIYECELPEISPIRFAFLRGVRTKHDMMRGEETEIVGLIDEFGTDCVYVLPGSHSKLIVPDSEKRIESFKTMMTGEMISALSKNTILNGTVDLSIKEHDTPSLIMGYEYCIKYGINDALFKTRILKNLFSKSDVEIYSYFLGVILANEIESLKRYNKKGVVIGGKSQLKKAMCDLLKATTDLEIISVPEKSVDDCVFMGQIKIFEYQKKSA